MMSMSNVSSISTDVPQKILDYFTIDRSDPAQPQISQVFRGGGLGWVQPGRGNVTLRASWDQIRNLQKFGITVIAVSYGSRTADFRIDELERYARRPLLAGSLV